MPKQSSLVRGAIQKILFLFVCTAGPLLYAGHWLIGESNHQVAFQSMNERGALVVQLLENDLQNKLQLLEHATGVFKIKDFSEVNRADVEDISSKFNGVVWAGLADVDGRVLYSTQGVLEGVSVKTRPWFKAGLVKPAVMDKHDALLLASKLPPRADPYKFIDITVPVFSRENVLKGVLGIHLDWTWYQNQFSELLGAQSSSSLISIVVTGPDGKLRLAKLGKEQVPGDIQDMLQELGSPDSQRGDYLVVSVAPAKTSRLASLGWTVNLLLPEKSVSQQTFSAVSLAFVALLVGMLAISVLMVDSARRLSRRIGKHLDVIESGSIENMAVSEQTLPREAMPLMVRTRELFGKASQRAQLLQEQLEKAELSFTEINSLIQQAPVAIAMFDQDMVCLACSGLWKKTYCVSGFDPIGSIWVQSLTRLDGQWDRLCARGQAGEALQRENELWVDAKGREIWVNVSIEPWKNQEGLVAGIVVATQDVTQSHLAQAALAASEERFQLAMEGSSDGLWDWNTQTGEVYLSPGWKKMLGYEPHELENSFETYKNLFHAPDWLPAQTQLNKTIANSTADSLSLTFQLLHKKGHLVKILSRAKIIRDSNGQALRVVGTHLDRTEIENLQQALQEAWVLAQAESKSNEAKSRFLATVSHEIRNPLNAVTGFARLIAEETTNDRVGRYAQLLNQTTDSLRLVLNDILDFAKIEAGKLEIIEADFNLAELMDGLAESTRLQCQEKFVSFELTKEWNAGFLFKGDAGRIRQITQNLLSNALKFTAQGLIALRVFSKEVDALKANIVIEVADSGRGIAKDKLDSLFKPFSQVHNDSASKFGGTGLGLTIVKSLAQAMGGEVSCQSEEDVGSVFQVHLTLLKAEKAASSAPKPEAATRSKRVLIADDMPTNLQILNAFLTKRGHRVTTVQTGTAAFDLLQTEAFDFVLLDLDMPGMSGFEVVKAIRNETGPNQKAVFACVTGHAMRETMGAVHAAGFNLFIPKPVDFDQLIAAVSH